MAPRNLQSGEMEDSLNDGFALVWFHLELNQKLGQKIKGQGDGPHQQDH